MEAVEGLIHMHINANTHLRPAAPQDEEEERLVERHYRAAADVDGDGNGEEQ